MLGASLKNKHKKRLYKNRQKTIIVCICLSSCLCLSLEDFNFVVVFIYPIPGARPSVVLCERHWKRSCKVFPCWWVRVEFAHAAGSVCLCAYCLCVCVWLAEEGGGDGERKREAKRHPFCMIPSLSAHWSLQRKGDVKGEWEKGRNLTIQASGNKKYENRGYCKCSEKRSKLTDHKNWPLFTWEENVQNISASAFYKWLTEWFCVELVSSLIFHSCVVSPVTWVSITLLGSILLRLQNC